MQIHMDFLTKQLTNILSMFVSWVMNHLDRGQGVGHLPSLILGKTEEGFWTQQEEEQK